MNTVAFPPELDQPVRAWFSTCGLAVTGTHYEFDREFFAWRYDGNKQSFTLWISKHASEDHAPRTLLTLLKDYDPNTLMTKWRHVHLHVTSPDGALSTFAREKFAPDDA